VNCPVLTGHLSKDDFRIGILRCCWGRGSALAQEGSREKTLLCSEVRRQPWLTAVQCIGVGTKWSPEEVGWSGFRRSVSHLEDFEGLGGCSGVALLEAGLVRERQRSREGAGMTSSSSSTLQRFVRVVQ